MCSLKTNSNIISLETHLRSAARILMSNKKMFSHVMRVGKIEGG